MDLMQQGAFGAVFGDPFLRGEVLRPSVDFGTRDLCTLRAVSVAFRGDTLLVSRFEQEVQRRVAFVLHLLVEEVAQPVDYATARRESGRMCVGCGARPDADGPTSGSLCCGAPYAPGHLDEAEQTECCRFAYRFYEEDDGRYYEARARRGGLRW